MRANYSQHMGSHATEGRLRPPSTPKRPRVPAPAPLDTHCTTQDATAPDHLGLTITPEGRAFRPHQTRANNTPHPHTPRQTHAAHPRCHLATKDAAHPKRPTQPMSTQHNTRDATPHCEGLLPHEGSLSSFVSLSNKNKIKRGGTRNTMTTGAPTMFWRGRRPARQRQRVTLKRFKARTH